MVKINQLLFTLFALLANDIKHCASINSAFSRDTLIEGCTRFSFDLFRTLNSNQTAVGEPKDLFFSPYSIWSALVVTYMGARGATRQEMQRVLGIGDASKSETWRTFRSIYHPSSYNELVETHFTSASRIYFQKGTTLKKYWQKTLQRNVAFVDFHNQAEEARKIINMWVERYTHRRIKNLIPPFSINRMTNMVIANAVYFKEEWLQPFEPQNTSRRKFTVSPQKTIYVTMMTTRGVFLYGKSNDLRCSILEIPYSDNDVSMTILLPYERCHGINYLVNNLSPEKLRQLQESMQPRDVTLSIPKFKVEDTYELSSALQRMGLRTLFDESRVNLSGFTGKREFRLDSVRHKTFIDVNEQGTEASAATDMFYFRSALPRGRVTFDADHPFVYFIQDNNHDTILFMGIIRKPQAVSRY